MLRRVALAWPYGICNYCPETLDCSGTDKPVSTRSQSNAEFKPHVEYNYRGVHGVRDKTAPQHGFVVTKPKSTGKDEPSVVVKNLQDRSSDKWQHPMYSAIFHMIHGNL